MMKKLTMLLFACILLVTCRTEDLAADAGSSRSELQSKSPWEEDETYILNVKEIYEKNQDEINPSSEKPLWEYAMTMGHMDEGFLIVPMMSGKEVSSVMKVPRVEDKVYFLKYPDEEYMDFFQALINAPAIKDARQEISTSPISKVVCTTRYVSTWYPDDENNPDPGSGSGHWQTVPVTECRVVKGEDTCFVTVGETCSDFTGYDYGMGGGGGGGSGGNPNDNQNNTPCEKTKQTVISTDVKNVVQDLKNHIASGAGGEKGWKFNKNGSPTETTENGAHSVNFGSPNLINGGYHNHTGEGVDIFSASDINTLLSIARYNGVGNPTNAFMGLIAPNGIHYVIRFDGTQGDLPPEEFKDFDIDLWNVQQTILMYDLQNESGLSQFINGKKVLNDKGLERILFDTLEKMGLDKKVVVQKIDDNNKVSTVNKNSDGTTTAVPCY